MAFSDDDQDLRAQFHPVGPDYIPAAKGTRFVVRWLLVPESVTRPLRRLTAPSRDLLVRISDTAPPMRLGVTPTDVRFPSRGDAESYIRRLRRRYAPAAVIATIIDSREARRSKPQQLSLADR
jgi:hypothetical protein